MPPSPRPKRQPRKRGTETYFDKLSRIRKKASDLSERHGKQAGYRSGLEYKCATWLLDQGIEFNFEGLKLPYMTEPTQHVYTPDFPLTKFLSSGKMLVLETKGRFMPDDMRKHLLIKKQHPMIDVRLVFQNSKGWHRAAKTKSYAKWCDENGIKYCDYRDLATVLPKWLEE